MKSNQSNNSAFENIWKFIRGDMLASDFENWVYSNPTLENIFGKTLHLEIISTNFSSKDIVFQLKKTLKEFAISSTDPSCMCLQLSNIAVVDMGDESEKVFTTFDQIKKRGNPYWWLSVYQCNECQQSWLVAQEERQNDVFCLYRLDTAMADDILNNNRWIPIFDHYEDLLRIGLEAGKSVRFFEPLNSRSLRWTISDLARDKPGISISKIANLLNLDLDLAEEIAKKVIEEDGVSIFFDGVK
jgi:hypothetical protein